MPLQWSIGDLNVTLHGPPSPLYLMFTLANSPESSPWLGNWFCWGRACGQWCVRAFPAEWWKHLDRLQDLGPPLTYIPAQQTHPWYSLSSLSSCSPNTQLYSAKDQGPLMWHTEEVPASTLASFGPSTATVEYLNRDKSWRNRIPDTLQWIPSFKHHQYVIKSQTSSYLFIYKLMPFSLSL